MAYVSLFDKLSQTSAFGKAQSAYEGQFQIMAYKGNLAQVLTELITDLSVPLTTGEQIARITLNTPRIVRAAIDNKISNPSEKAEKILYEALGLALKIYAGSSTAIDGISSFVSFSTKTRASSAF